MWKSLPGAAFSPRLFLPESGMKILKKALFSKRNPLMFRMKDGK